MSFPAYIIQGENLQRFVASLHGDDDYQQHSLSEIQDEQVVEVVRDGNRLLVALSRLPEYRECVVVKWRFKTRLFSSSKELNNLLRTALASVNAVSIESFLEKRAAK
ncbi:MAG: hypothetical protein M9920_01140 [Verrucomicrobiae bacterium]|nr:hypothetical protein [Verrucomicrobiae bacterium]